MGSCISTASQPSLARSCSTTFCGIGAGAVHLVDEGQPGDVIAPHLAVDGQRLGLHAADGAEHQDRPVQDAEAPLDLDGEIDVARACRSG